MTGKLTLRWEKDDPSFALSSDWNTNASTTYNAERAAARRAAPSDATDFTTLPEPFLVSPTLNYPSRLTQKNKTTWEFSEPDFVNNGIIGNPYQLFPKRAHCVYVQIPTEDCYTDNIVLKIEDVPGIQTLPASIENKTYVLRMHTVAGARRETQLCATRNCRSILKSEVKSGSEWITPPQYSITKVGDANYTASNEVLSIRAVDVDDYGNPLNERIGIFSVTALEGTPIVFNSDLNSQDLANANESGNLFTWQPKYTGKFVLNWASNVVSINPTASTGMQTVQHAAPARLRIDLWAPATAAPPTGRRKLNLKEPVFADIAYEPEVVLTDMFGNTVTSFNGAVPVSWILSSDGIFNEEGYQQKPPNSSTCTFTAGVCTLGSTSALRFMTSNLSGRTLVSVSAQFSSPLNATFAGTTSFGIDRFILPGTFDHFLTFPTNTEQYRNAPGGIRFGEISYRSKPDGSSKFAVEICMVDKYGNLISPPTNWSGHDRDISISVQPGVAGFDFRNLNPDPDLQNVFTRNGKPEGLRGPLSGIRINGTDSQARPCVKVENLSYDTWGMFQIIASDGIASRTTPAGQSNVGNWRTPIIPNPFTDLHVLETKMVMFGNPIVKVGDRIRFDVAAFDKYGELTPVLLGTNWTLIAPPSPKGNPALLEWNPNFGAPGSGYQGMYLFKAGLTAKESISLIPGDGGVNGSVAHPDVDILVLPDMPSLAQVSAPAAENAQSWPADIDHPLEITVTTTDAHGNPTLGPASVELIATNTRDVTDTNGNNVATGPCMFQPPQGTELVGWKDVNSKWRSRDFRLSLANNEGRWQGMVWYCYGHTVDISVVAGTAVVEKTATVRFKPTLLTINAFHVSSPVPPAEGTQNVTISTGPANMTLHVEAISGNQRVYGVDNLLNAIPKNSLIWDAYFDGGAEKRGTYSANVKGVLGNFTNGLASATHTVYKAKTFNPNKLTFSGFLSADVRAWQTIDVRPAALDELLVAFDEVDVFNYPESDDFFSRSTGTIAKPTSAGQAPYFFALPVDSYGNPVLDNCQRDPTTKNITENFTVTPLEDYQSSGGHGGMVVSPSFEPLIFDNNNINMKSYFQGRVQLVKAVNHNLMISGCGTSKIVSLDVSTYMPKNIWLSLVNDAVQATHASSIRCSNRSGTISEVDLRNRADVDCPRLYAFAWDSFGNQIQTLGESSCAKWDFVDQTPNKVSIVSGIPSTSSHDLALKSSNYLDGKITCQGFNTATLYGSAETLASGGLSRVEVSHTPLSQPLFAGSNNLVISNISLFSRENGIEIPFDAATDVAQIIVRRLIGQDPVPTGVSEFSTLNLVNGVHSSPISLSLREVGDFTLSINVRDRVYSKTVSVVPAPAEKIFLEVGQNTATSPIVAGIPFRVYASVRDAFQNKTYTPANNASNCSLTMSAAGRTVQNQVQGFASYPPLFPTETRFQDDSQTYNSGWANYAPWDITLYATGANRIIVSGCGLTQYLDVNVGQAALEKITLNSTNDINSPHEESKLCSNTSALTGAVQCSMIYAFFWDTYGNSFDDGSAACTSWQLSENSSTAPLPPASGRIAFVNHSTYLDANLTCIKGNKAATTLLYGGLSRLEMTTDYGSNNKSQITAGIGNMLITGVKFFQRRNNIEIPKTDVSTSVLSLSTNSILSLGQLGQNSSVSCVNNASGECTSVPFAMNFTITETGREIAVSLHGLTQKQTGINVVGAAASKLIVQGIPDTIGADTPFDVSVTVRDAFDNFTNVNCGELPTADASKFATLSVAGGGKSPGLHGATATNPNFTTPIAQNAVGIFMPLTAKLYKEGLNTLMISACGISENKIITVEEGPVTFVNVTDDPLGIQTPNARQCPNSGAGNSVSCGTLYAFMWDAFGNAAADSTGSKCDQWSFDDLSGGTSGTPTMIPNDGNTRQFVLNHQRFLDGKVKCRKNSIWGELSVFGGIKKITAKTSYRDPNDAANSSTKNMITGWPSDGIIVANTGNVRIDSLSLWTSFGGSEVLLPGSENQNIALSTSNFGYSYTGQPANLSCTFVDGVCNLNASFNFVYRTSSLVNPSVGVTLSATVRSVTGSAPDFFISPNLPSQFYSYSMFDFYPFAAPIAGVPFEMRPDVVDAFFNRTTACGQITVSGALPSPGGHGGTATSPLLATTILPNSNQMSYSGQYSIQNVTLYRAGTTSLLFSTELCPTITYAHSLNVKGAALNAVTLHAIDALNVNGVASPYRCSNTGDNGSVDCGSLSAYFWDQYGNSLDAENGGYCSSWSWENYGPAQSPANLQLTNTHAVALNSPNYIDGKITCSKTLADHWGTSFTRSAVVDIFGGASRLEVVNDYQLPNQKNFITAGSDNLQVSALQVYQMQQGNEVLKSDASLRSVAISTNSKVGTRTLGLTSPASCDFGTTGICSSGFSFNFTRDEGGPGDDPASLALTFSTMGQSYSIDNIRVDPGVASEAMTGINIPAQVVAGEPFAISVVARDIFGNRTANGCSGAPLVVTGGQASSGNGGGEVKQPVMPASAAQTSLGSYSLLSATLYREGSTTLTFNLCGITPITKTVNVTEGPVATVWLNDSATTPAAHKSEIVCRNSDSTSAAVTCGTISPFFFDAYGNSVGDPSNSCDSWIVTSRETAGGGSQPSALTNRTVGGGFALNHTDWVDSTLTCNKTGANGTVSATSLVYGGLKNITATVTQTGPPYSLVAGIGNLTVSNITLTMQKNGVDIGKMDGGLSTLTLTENSVLTTTELGQRDLLVCSFSSLGICPDTFNFNFTKVENNVALNFAVYGKTFSVSDISVTAGPAATVSVDTIPAQTAGLAFNATVRVFDAAGNPTSVGCDAGQTPTGFNLTGAAASAGGHGGTATSPVLPQTTTLVSTGVYTVSGITLYKKGSNNLSFAACGAGSAASRTVTVNEAALNAVTLHTSDDSALNHSAQVRCEHSGTGTDVSCNPLYAFFWDTYGNMVGGNSDSCDTWSWSNRTNGGAPASTPTVSTTASHSKSFTHTAHVNGDLTCSRTLNSVSKTISTNLYGGISRMVVTTSPVTTSGSGSVSIAAATSNFTLAKIELFMKKGDAEVLMENAGTLPVSLTTDYSDGITGLGRSASESCAFNSTTGVCTPNWTFNFTKVQASARYLNFTLRSAFAHNIPSITVTANTANTITVDAIGTVGAGVAFRPTVHVKDAQGNYTTLNCNSGNPVTWSAAPTSNGIPGQSGTAKAPVYPSTMQVSSAAALTMGTDMKLYSAGTYNITVAACGLTNNAVPVTVTADPFFDVTLNTAASDDKNGTPVTGVVCSQAATNDPTNKNISCSTIRAFFWDQYGNTLSDGICDSWQWTPYGSSQSPAGGWTSSSHNISLTHTQWLDGRLTCNKTISGVAKNKATDVYGGMFDFTSTTAYNGASVMAANSNLSPSNLTLRWYKQGALVTKTDTPTAIAVKFTTTSAVNSVPVPNQNITFTNGVANSGLTSFSYTLVESSNSKISMQVFGITQDIITNINVTPARANSLTVVGAPTSITAGTQSASFQVDAKDAFGNYTTLDATTGSCGALTISGANASPNGTAATAASVGTITSPGSYVNVAFTLVKEETATLTFTACGKSTTANVAVGEAALNSVRLSTSGSDASPPAHVTTPIYCGFSTAGATNNNISCSAINAYALDTYGNAIGNAANPCTSWTYAPKTGGGVDLDASTPLTASNKSQTLTHTDFIDGDLTCTNGAMSASVNVYGGVESISATTTQTRPLTIFAGSNNLTVNSVTVNTRQGGNSIALPAAANGSQTITWSTTATQTSNSVFGGSATSTCSFANGVCSTSKTLSFTKAPESSRTVTLNVRGKTFDLTGISVDPNDVVSNSGVTVNPVIGTQTAGAAFTAQVETKDAQGNLTNKNCGNLSVSGGNTSPFSNAPSLPTAVAQDTLGHYTTGNITLYKSGSQTLTFTACGYSTTATVSVNAAAQNSVRLSTTDNDASPPATLSEVYCPFTTASTTNSVTCPTIYAYNLDTYGNAVAGSTACSSWTWTPETGSLTPSNPSAGRSASLTGTGGYLDGSLRCNTSAGMNQSIVVYGGIKSIGLSSYTGSPSATTITAGSANYSIGNIQIYTQKQGTSTLLPAAADGSQSVGLTVSSGTMGELTSTSSPQSCTFTNGTCASPWGSLNFTSATTTAKTLTFTLRGVTVTTPNITVNPAAQHHLTIVSPLANATWTAGGTNTARVEVRDQYENVVPSSTCTTLTPSVTSGTSPLGNTPTLNALGAHTNGVYNFTGLVLVNRGTNLSLQFSPSGCALTAPSVSLSVNEGTLNEVRLSTSGSDSAPPAHMNSLLCNLSNASPSASNAIACSTVSAYALDAYGNAVGTAANPCSSWTYTPKTGGGVDLDSSTPLTSANKSQSLSHTDFIDGDLTCSRTVSGTTRTGTINVYGGVSAIDILSNERTSTAIPLITGNNNFTVSNVRMYARQGGSQITFPTDGSQQVSVTTTYSGGVSGASGLNFTSPQNCAFSAGVCNGNYSFSFNSSATNASLTFSVRGKPVTISGINVNTPASLALSPTSKDFGTQPVGSTTEQKFTLSNSGQTAASSLAAGTLNAPYAFKGGTYPGTGGTCSSSLGASSSCDIYVVFTPTTSGTFNGQSLSLTYNNGLAAGQTASAALTGAALPPASLSISDASYSYGNVTVSGTAGSKVFTLSNSGSFAATGVSVSGYANGFTQTATTCTTSLAASASCTITVQFAPSTAGSKSFTLKADYNNGVSAQSATNSISGYGLNAASVTASPSTWNAGSVVAGTTAEQTITFTNASGDTASANGLSLGALGSQFRFKGGSAPGTGGSCGSSLTTLAAGASCTVVVEYAPTVAQADSATLTLSFNNGIANTNRQVSLSGSATPAAAATVAASLSTAGSKIAGQNFTVKLIVTDAFGNRTDSGCNVNSIGITGATAAPTGHGNAVADTPTFPTTMTKNSVGDYTTGNIALFNAEESPSLIVNACGSMSNGVSVTIVPDALSTVWLDTSNSEPASHSASANCGDGTSLNCTLYAFGWDQYGNSLPSEAGKSSFTCNQWTLTNSSGSPSISATGSAHSTVVSSTTSHIDASLACVIGSVTNTTTLSGRIHLPYTLNCNRTCDQDNNIATASCEVSNSTGYGASFSLSPDQGTADSVSGDCTSGSGSCSSINVTGFGTTNTLTIGVSGTENDSGKVNLLDPSSAGLSCP
jgi:hypothetical protein